MKQVVLVGMGRQGHCSCKPCSNAPIRSISGVIRGAVTRDILAYACATHLEPVMNLVIALAGKAEVEAFDVPPPPPPPDKEDLPDVSALKKTHEIYAVGETPEGALEHLGLSLGWGEVENFSDLKGGSPEFEWGRRFTAGGTSMKAAGWRVPGGVVVAWWK